LLLGRARTGIQVLLPWNWLRLAEILASYQAEAKLQEKDCKAHRADSVTRFLARR
jgi:hypothetical protein